MSPAERYALLEILCGAILGAAQKIAGSCLVKEPDGALRGLTTPEMLQALAASYAILAHAGGFECSKMIDEHLIDAHRFMDHIRNTRNAADKAKVDTWVPWTRSSKNEGN